MIRMLAPGVLLTTIMGIASYFVARLHGTLDALVVALLGGMIVRLIFGRQKGFDIVIAYAKDFKDVLIPIGVILYAATINVSKTFELPGSVYLKTFISVVVLFAVALFLGKLLKLNKKTSWLTAVGSSICGASAIAITSTAVDAKEEDISNSLIAIVVAGILAVGLSLTVPFISNLGSESFAVFSGATMNQTGLVKIATSALGPLQKDLALPVKLLRTAIIPFVALIFFFITISKEGYKKNMRFLLVVLIAFIVLLGLTALSPGFAAITKIKGIKIAATIIFATAFVNLGLLVDFKTFKFQPIIVAFLAWVTAAAAFLLMA
ncbi:MAG TPA: hypothetical protein DCO77_03485 [Nitrospiraceae bacterium]|nr:hypothetical protein [Nitrospiraceae bacterium]